MNGVFGRGQIQLNVFSDAINDRKFAKGPFETKGT